MERRYFLAVVLGGALISPLALHADDRDDHRRENRYYDPYRKDWHEWNEREERAYRHWLEEQRREYHNWARASREEQREYWRWRHGHRDWDDDRR